MRLRWSYRSLLFIFPLVIGFSISQTAAAAPRTVWQIGKFDHSSAEFNHAAPGAGRRGGRTSQGPLVYVVGKSTPQADWPAFQPGSSNRKAGYRDHAYTIQFNLPDRPKGLYILKVGLVALPRGRLSILQTDINGRVGWAYQHPLWGNVPGDKHWNDTLDVELPTTALKQGVNRLVLTAVAGPALRHDHRNPGLTYDALELDQDPGRRFRPGEMTVRVEPTIFYQQENGHLAELVDVYVHHNAPARQGRVELNIGGEKFSTTFASRHDFGEEKVEFRVPEFEPGTKGGVSVTMGRHRRHFAAVLDPARKWTLYLVPSEHLDVGYTDYQPKVAELQSRVLDEAIQMIHAHPDFRYSPDGYWVFQQFLAGRDAADRQRLLQLVKAHKIIAPAQYANLLTEFPGVETLIRSLYPSFEFDQKYGGRFNYANITDVPSYTWSYASILAAAGLKYFLAGSNQTRGPILMLSHLEEQSPFWWEGPDGGKVLMWYSNSYGQIGAVFGLPPEVEVGHDTLPRFLQIYSTPEYKLSSVILFGAQWENSDLYPQQASIAGEWNKTYAYPKLIYAGFAKALSEIARQAGSSIPTFKGDGGPYWEDGIYSDTHYALLARETEQRAPSAEKISTISSIVYPYVHPATGVLRRLWQNMILFDEHTWGAAASIRSPQSEETVRQIAVKDAFATQAHQDLNYLLERGMADISDRINEPPGTLVVFNPLNWQRSGFVELDLPGNFELVDLVNGGVVPYQVLSDHAGYEHIRFMADAVPSLGYKCYTMRPAVPKPAKPPASVGTILENAYYRVALDPETGAVKSIFDKQLNKELVNVSSPYRFDQYLYVTGGDEPVRNRLIYSDPTLPLPRLTIHNAHNGRLISVENTPFGTVAHLESSDTNTPQIETDVILFNSQKKIEFVNHVQKKKVYTKEAVYFAFPFAMDHPQFRYDIQNGIVNPALDLLPGAAREWFSCQHWVAARQGGATAALIPLDAELFSLGDIVRGEWPLHLGRRQGTIFSYVMNNYWFTNYVAAQGGDYTFRYVFTSGSNLGNGRLSRLGWEEMTPFETNTIIPNDKNIGIRRPQPLSAGEGSFLQTNQPNVLLVNWKRAEDGHGTILRFLELAGKGGEVKIHVPILNVQQSWLCNAMEQNQEPLPTSAHGLAFPVKPFQIVTLRVTGTPAQH
jgi:alpha-mannosidase